ncbi:hypothetical protein ScPMuIL_018205 [Solemya velum]
METDEHSLYTEAAVCLEQTLREGEKTANVDIQLMLANLQRSDQLIQQACDREHDPFYINLLVHLHNSLGSHAGVLEAKINQLNNGPSIPPVSGGRDTPQGGNFSDDSQKHARESAIADTIVIKDGLNFSDVVGLDEAKQSLREAIIMPLHFPHLFTGSVKPWKRILLYGPPGTGKSRLAQAISAEISSTFYCVSSSDLVSSWVGESEKLIKELFHHATSQSGRSVIFIDEIDSICRQRSSREGEHTRRIKTELLRQMEGADNTEETDKIFLLCATNCPWELDTAFLRRFQKRIYIPLPDSEARIELMKLHTKNNKVNLTEQEWMLLSDKTRGYSGSDIANMTLGALFIPIRDLKSSKHWELSAAGQYTPCDGKSPSAVVADLDNLPPDKIIPREVTVADFIKSIQTHRKTVTQQEHSKFDDFTTHFGEKG